MRQNHQKNKEARNQRRMEQYRNHLEEAKAYAKKYQKEHREAINARGRKHRAENIENNKSNVESEEKPLEKCKFCMRAGPTISFNYGCVSCDKCIDYKRAWNQKRSDEIHKLYPKTYCHICKFMSRDINWNTHLTSKMHAINLQKLKETSFHFII